MNTNRPAVSDDALLELSAFVRVVEAGGFRAAARAGGVRKATLSQRFRALEERTGVTLAHRTTRSLRLTEEGEALLAHARAALEHAALAQAAISSLRDTPSGTLRISAHPALASVLVLKVLTPLMQRFPDLDIDLRVETRRVDLLREPVELALRVGALPDASLQARRVGTIGGGIYGSPAYLLEHGEPQHPDELTDHALLAVPWRDGPIRWPLVVDGGLRSVEVSPRLQLSDLRLAVLAAAGGAGLVRAPEPLARDLLQAGQLQPVLVPFSAPPSAVFAVMPPGASLVPRVRVVLDAVARWDLADD